MLSTFAYILGIGLASLIVARVYEMFKSRQYHQQNEKLDKLKSELHTISEDNKKKEQTYEEAKQNFFSKYLKRK